jgi:hypothetical protein
VEALIAEGHTGAMDYSIRQVEAFTWLMDRRKNRDNARALQVASLAAHGKQAEVNKRLKEWTK